PATIIKSDWRGLGRKIPAPKRSISKRDAPVAIISIAQHANPKVMGHSADLRAQLNTKSTVVVMMFFSNRSSIQAGIQSPELRPIQGALLYDPNITNDQNSEKDQHFNQAEQVKLPVDDGPGEQENGLNVKDHEQNRHHIVADCIALPRIGVGIDAA